MLKDGVILNDRYVVMSRIGSGGMADVYKAEDRKLNRLVAIKVMKAEFREDTGFVAKFQKEAQAAAKLSHPNVVNVYDVGEDRGLYFIVMELVEGITLKNYIAKKGKLSVKEATSIAIQVSLGLEAAHNVGIIHRDVKPQNIMISTDGKVKLSDFGIAKAINSNTITANVMGSVHYSSPEQVRGGFSDARSDIYSLGITMYEMVTGRVPFDGDTTVAIAIKHLQEEIVPPSIYTPDLPYSLEQIILKCTQKDPDRRYQTAGELIEDLKRSLIDPQGSFVTVTPLAAHAETAAMTDRQMDNIRHNDGSAYRSRNNDDYDDDDDDDDDDDNDDGHSSGLEKTLTIVGYIVGAVIIVILILVIGNMAGVFNFGSKNNASSASSAAETTATPTPEASSSSSEGVEVPDFRGMTVDEATTEANKYGIGIYQTATEASDDYPEGQIINQSVEPGTTVDKGTTINVTVSTGESKVTIPTGIAGMDQSDAESALDALGLVTEIELQYDDEADVGTVISCDPAEGSQVAKGSTVKLYISKGQDDSNNVSVPAVVGQTQKQAEQMLDSVGLSYTVKQTTDESKENGIVISCSPDVGESVEKGTTVTLTVNSIADSSSSSSGSGKYVCYSPLSQPSGYNGGHVKLVLVQGNQSTTIYDGDNPWTNGTYSTPIESTSGETGEIDVYEDDTLIAKYPNVTFQAE